MDDAEAFKALKDVCERGNGILKHQPVVRETCEAWTRGAREACAAIYGPASAGLRVVAAAHRRIMTNFDTDPSYYLTQVVANLHRELKVIDKLLKGKEEAAREQGGLAKALRVFAGVVWARSAAAAEGAAALLAKGNLQVLVVEEGGDLLARIMTLATLRYGVVSAPPDASGGLAPAAAFAAGCLASRLGVSRVAVLLEAPQKLPAAMGPLRAFDLADEARWRAQIAADLGKIAK